MRKNKILLKSAAAMLSLMMMGSMMPGMNVKAMTEDEAREYCNKKGMEFDSLDAAGNAVCIKKETVEVPSNPEPDTPIYGNIFKLYPGYDTPTINAGESKVIEFPIVYATKKTATSYEQAQITLPDGLYFYEANDIQSFDVKTQKDDKRFEGKVAILKASISASSDAKSGTVTVPIKITYKYSGNSNPITETVNAYIKINGTDSNPANRLKITNYSFDRQNIKAGEAFNLTVELNNPSNGAVKNVNVNIGNLTTETIMMNNAIDTMYLPELPANSTKTLTFPMIASKNIDKNSQMLELSVTADGIDSPLTSKIFAFISKSADGSEAALNGKPKIVIDSYDYGGTAVTGGQPFDLSMVFRNTSSNITIENLKMTIQSVADEKTGGAFTPTSSSNSFFVKSIAPNGSIGQSINLMPKADADPKSYGLEIRFEFEYVIKGELQEGSSTEQISIPLKQSDRFEVGEVDMWGPIYVGMESQINVSYVNKGKSTINNLEISVEGENMTAMESRSYVGNVESGNSDYYSVNITANQEGPVKGKIKFSYEDANGQTVVVEKEFSSDAISMNFEPDPGMDIPEPTQPEGMPMWGKILIGVVVVGGIAAVAYVVIKKKKAKSKLQEAESYDDFPEDGE
ncbi:COG1361 S-layer family protein [Dielma fastidiosa]|uniref:CARDB domain-containing protein n=1 Tax=Dielma fastidiosa TaxID=1034346 RepID=A0AB35URN2_9FIRM|nr:hypothetical protein [Dielma fastidiosa]MDY5167844.1 hypothetical protein [Dielma fastidiosa]